MISIVELFGFISILFAIIAIRVYVKDQSKIKEPSSVAFAHSDEKIEPFVEIPLEQIHVSLNDAESGNLDELKDKIESFKERNRFYNL